MAHKPTQTWIAFLSGVAALWSGLAMCAPSPDQSICVAYSGDGRKACSAVVIGERHFLSAAHCSNIFKNRFALQCGSDARLDNLRGVPQLPEPDVAEARKKTDALREAFYNRQIGADRSGRSLEDIENALLEAVREEARRDIVLVRTSGVLPASHMPLALASEVPGLLQRGLCSLGAGGKRRHSGSDSLPLVAPVQGQTQARDRYFVSQTGAQTGDSGGGLICQDREGRWKALGIISFKTTEGLLASDVTSEKRGEWIRRHTWSFEPTQVRADMARSARNHIGAYLDLQDSQPGVYSGSEKKVLEDYHREQAMNALTVLMSAESASLPEPDGDTSAQPAL